jgi:hypothetical protein
MTRLLTPVQFLGACLQPGRTMLVTEYLAGGDLRGALSRHPGTFRWGAGGRGRALALDVARGLHYLHSRRIIHFIWVPSLSGCLHAQVRHQLNMPPLFGSGSHWLAEVHPLCCACRACCARPVRFLLSRDSTLAKVADLHN